MSHSILCMFHSILCMSHSKLCILHYVHVPFYIMYVPFQIVYVSFLYMYILCKIVCIEVGCALNRETVRAQKFTVNQLQLNLVRIKPIRTHNSSTITIQCKVNSLQRIFASLPFTHDYRACTVSLFKAHPTSIHTILHNMYIYKIHNLE